MKKAKQFSRQRTRHTFLLKAPADASCNAPCRLRGHGQPLTAHAKLSVPALSAFAEASADRTERPLRVSRVAASVVSRLARLPLVLQQAPHRLFPAAANPALRAVNPAKGGPKHVAVGHSITAALRRLFLARKKKTFLYPARSAAGPASPPQETCCLKGPFTA